MHRLGLVAHHDKAVAKCVISSHIFRIFFCTVTIESQCRRRLGCRCSGALRKVCLAANGLLQQMPNLSLHNKCGRVIPQPVFKIIMPPLLKSKIDSMKTLRYTIFSIHIFISISPSANFIKTQDHWLFDRRRFGLLLIGWSSHQLFLVYRPIDDLTLSTAQADRFSQCRLLVYRCLVLQA